MGSGGIRSCSPLDVRGAARCGAMTAAGGAGAGGIGGAGAHSTGSGACCCVSPKGSGAVGGVGVAGTGRDVSKGRGCAGPPFSASFINLLQISTGKFEPEVCLVGDESSFPSHTPAVRWLV